MMSVKELVQDLESLNEAELQEVATYVSFLKYRAQHNAQALPANVSRRTHLSSVVNEASPLATIQVWPGIEKTPGVVSGDACIINTRIPVWALEGYRRLGWNEAQILENFPTLRAADLAHAWSYVDAHQIEIEQALLEQEEA